MTFHPKDFNFLKYTQRSFLTAINTSKIFRKFAEKYSEVRTNPEKYLGPNCQEVIAFWLKLENLSEDQWKVVYERLRQNEFGDLFNKTQPELFLKYLQDEDNREVYQKTMGKYYVNEAAVCAEFPTYKFYEDAASMATKELICDVPFKRYLKMFDDL